MALALTLALSEHAAFAEEPAIDDGATEEVRVRGTAGGFSSTAREGETAREVTDAASLVAPMPGVHVRRLGADDSFATLSIRGTSSTQVAIFLAGVPLSGGADPTLDLATLPLWPGARARVFRSFAPAALGRGSLGGSLVIDPPSPRTPPRTDVWVGIGSFGSRRLRLGDVRGDESGVRVATGISATRSDDDFTYLDPLASAGHDTDVFATRTNAGHASASGLVSVAIPFSYGRTAEHHGALTSTTLAQARHQELPGTITGPTPDASLDSSRVLSALELSLPAGRGAFGTRIWGRRQHLSIRDSIAGARASLGPRSTDDTIVAVGGSVGWRGRPLEDVSIDARLDGSGERFAPGTWVGALAPPSALRNSLGIALDAEVRASERVTLSASGRGDAWFDTSDDAADRREARPTGHVGIETVVGPFVLASHLGVLARPASFVERFGNRGAFLGEPNLAPESATTVDAGARTGGRLDRRGRIRASAELVGFSTWADDLIVFVNQGAYGRAKATNIGRARLLGVEAEAKLALYDFDVRVSHTALATANESLCRVDAAGCERPRLPGRPEHDFVLDVAYTLGPVRASYAVDVITGIRADLTSQIVVPDRAIHSFAVRVVVPSLPGLTLGLDVRNLFDLRVAEYGGALGPVRAPIGDLFQYPLPGRSFLLTARWTSTPTPR